MSSVDTYINCGQMTVHFRVEELTQYTNNFANQLGQSGGFCRHKQINLVRVGVSVDTCIVDKSLKKLEPAQVSMNFFSSENNPHNLPKKVGVCSSRYELLLFCWHIHYGQIFKKVGVCSSKLWTNDRMNFFCRHIHHNESKRRARPFPCWRTHPIH